MNRRTSKTVRTARKRTQEGFPKVNLKEQIEKMQAELIPNIPEDAMATIMKTSTELVESGLSKSGLAAGAKAPEFTLADATNKQVSSTELLKSGPLVINFYRGAWCPYCNVELNALSNALPEIKGAGGQLVAISPNAPDTALTTVEKHSLEFPVLSDLGNKTAKEFGLVFPLADELRKIYLQFGFDVPAQNGDDSWTLPMPATFVLDQNGTIVHAFVNADYTQREEPSVIVEALKRLRQNSTVNA